MTLEQLIKIADEAYGPDGMVQQYFENPDGEFGDGLARFVAVEIGDTYDGGSSDVEQLEAAVGVMDSAAKQIDAVTAAFDREFGKRMP